MIRVIFFFPQINSLNKFVKDRIKDRIKEKEIQNINNDRGNRCYEKVHIQEKGKEC